MLRLKSWLAALGILTLLAACASEPEVSPPEPSETAPVEMRDPAPSDGSLKTDRNDYVASCQGEGNFIICTFTLTMTYTNRTNETIYFDHCYPEDTTPIFGLRGLTQEESAYNPVWACVGLLERTVKVEAGQQRTDRFEVSGPNIWDGVTHEPFGLLEGRLQVSYQAYSCPGDDDFSDPYACKLADETATSNVFTVTLPD